MKVGIVGSRRFTNKQIVYQLVDSLDKTDIIISGGAIGVDTFAEERAKERCLETLIFLPKIKKSMSKYEIIQAYYDRNKKIAEYSDVINAFVVDNKGGTWNTIKWAKKLNKPVIIHREKRDLKCQTGV